MNKFFTATITFLIFSTIIFAEEMTPLQLLEKYKANRGLLKSHIIQSEELTEVIDSAYGNTPQWVRTIAEFRTDGNRVDSTTKRWINLSAPGDQCPDEDAGINTVIWDGKRWITFQQNTEQASISEKEKHKNEFVSYGYSGASLNGFFWGDKKPVENILAQSTKIDLRSQMDKVSGVNCYVIDADTTYGKYSLWIDPDHGYGIARAKVSKSGNDIVYDRVLQQIDISDFTFSIDNVEFQKIGNGWVPISADYQVSTQYADGRIITEKTNHKRIQINPNPDFKAIGAFVPNIPDGTYIAIEGVDGIGYRWLQGKPVPNIDKSFFEQLDDMTEQIKREEKSEVVNVTNKTIENPDKKVPVAIDMPAKSPNAKDSKQKDSYELSSFSVSKLVLAGVIVVGIGGCLVFRLARRRNHAGD